MLPDKSNLPVTSARDTFLAEAWAVLIGIQVTLERGISNVIVELDSTELVNIVNNQQRVDPCHHLSNIINSILQSLKSLNQVIIIHCFREANGCADLLSKLAHSCPIGVEIHERPPSLIEHQLFSDYELLWEFCA